MSEDPRCCGTGACIIDSEGRCWCGQRWDGEKMCQAPLASAVPDSPAKAAESPGVPTGSGSPP
jgi:hypothetical protein